MIRSGLVGRSILASRSPWLHEQEARAQGVELSYTLFDFTDRGHADAELPAVLRGLAEQGYAGVNVTYPFKQAVLPLLDGLADSAAAVGAVNTIAMREGRMIGHNTDMTGFRDSLRHGLPTAAMGRVLQMGAGGAGAAVATALLSLKVGELVLCDTDADRATALADSLGARFPASTVTVRRPDDIDLRAMDGMVNATPIGMAAYPGTPIATDLLRPHQWVADIVYFPLHTQLLQEAKARGCAVLNGSGMVIRQAALAFDIITGMTADVERLGRSFADYRKD